jgi:predicted anti-sigma-YlaC factor YlaD
MKNLLLLVVAALLCSCATTGPISGPAVAGAAAMVAVFDQLLAGGVIDPMQHAVLTQGIGALQQTVEAVKDAQAGTLTTETAATAAGGLTAAILAAIRLRHSPGVRALLSGAHSAPRAS